MKYSEIQEMKLSDLQGKLKETQQEYNTLKFSHAVSPIENPMQIKNLRREIAQMKTALHEKVMVDLADKVKGGEITFENARQFLSANQFDTKVGISKLKRIINNAQ
jgi:ribosomal protein L29